MESKDKKMIKQNQSLTKSEFIGILDTFTEKERYEILVEKLNIDHEKELARDRNILIAGISILFFIYLIIEKVII